MTGQPGLIESSLLVVAGEFPPTREDQAYALHVASEIVQRGMAAHVIDFAARVVRGLNGDPDDIVPVAYLVDPLLELDPSGIVIANRMDTATGDHPVGIHTAVTVARIATVCDAPVWLSDSMPEDGSKLLSVRTIELRKNYDTLAQYYRRGQ